MKLRVRGNSLRLRLTRGEVAAFDRDGRVEDAVRFGAGASLSYALERSAGGALAAAMEGGRIVVRVPAAMAEPWCRTAQVGLEGTQPIDEGETLRLLIEKDFTCLKTRRDEDESDAFPNPHDHC